MNQMRTTLTWFENQKFSKEGYHLRHVEEAYSW